MMRLIATAILLALNLTGTTGWLGGRLASLESASLGQPAANHHQIIKVDPAKPAQPVKIGAASLVLGAAGGIAVDPATNTVLFEQAGNRRLPIASITKLATAVVILGAHDLDQTVTVPALPAYPEGAELMGLQPGQQFKLRDLLRAALIPSYNDAADALAIWDSGSLAGFITKMNQLTSDWGIGGVHFTSANGLSESDNYASAAALVKLAKLALTSPVIRQTVAQTNLDIADLAGQGYHLGTTNELLRDPRFSGIKTGYTVTAGQCLVALAKIHDQPVITVVLGSPDRFGETAALVNYLERNYQWL
jgi:D-alanyl-D-alanine carboxypeptidase